MQIPVIEIAHKLGLSTIVFDAIPSVGGASLAHKFCKVDISDEQACVNAALELSRESPLHGVITVGTDFSTTVARITETLGLPGHTYTAATLAKDKFHMRRAFKAAGVPSPEYCQVETFEDLKLVDFDPPWVVKPVDSMGARGVQLVSHREALAPAVEEAWVHSRKKAALVEEFIPGKEFSIDALVSRGEIKIQGLADRDIWFPPRFIEMGHRFPTVLDEKQQEKLLETFKAGVRSLGLTHGAAKGDMRWHPQKGPMVGEIAGRLSGGFMSGWTYPLSSHFSSIEQAIHLALGEEIALSESLGGDPVAERAFISAPGVIREIQGLETLVSLPGLKHLFWQKKPGDKVNFPQNNVEKIGNFILCESTVEKLDRNIHQVYSQVLVRLEPKGLETTQWFDSPEGPAAFSEGSEEDYYGLTRGEILESFKILTGTDGRALGHKDNRFWKYLEKGGLQGLVYYWDSFS